MTIRFMRHYVTNGTTKARVHYSAHTLLNGKPCVTLYAKGYDDGSKLRAILPDGYENDTDIMTDYFEKGRARIHAGSPLYDAALARTVNRISMKQSAVRSEVNENSPHSDRPMRRSGRPMPPMMPN